MTTRGEDVESRFILRGENKTGQAFAQTSKALADLEKRAGRTGKALAGARGMGQAAGSRGSFPTMRFGMAAAAFGAGRYLRNQIGKADQITDLADSMGISPESAQTLRVLSRDTSVSFEGLGRTFAKLNDGMVEAQADPEGGIAEAFSLIGLSADRLKEMNVEQVFERLSRVMSDARSPAFQLKAAQDLLGGSATKLGAIYQQVGSQGFEALNAAMIKSGRIIDQEGITKLAQLEAKVEELQDKASVVTMKAMVSAAEASPNDAADKVQSFGKFLADDASRRLRTAFERLDQATNRPVEPTPFDRELMMSMFSGNAGGAVVLAIKTMSEEVVEKLRELNATAKKGGVWK